jgi:uncharacterized protein involved in type VI secretion and phage assembly
MGMMDLFSTDSPGNNGGRSRINGVVIGIVADIKDPMNLGRVKLLFPWLAEEKEETVHIEDDEERAHSYWARVATLMAGKKRGTFIIPEVDDEVLVAFEHGQIDRPVVIGMLWNSEDQPPVMMDGDGKNDIRAIHTRSGHKVVFNDSDDAPSILIVDNRGKNRIFINSKEKKMEIEAEGDLTITVGGKLAITAKSGITIESSADVSVKAQANMNLEATSAFSAKGNSKAALESSAQTEVKGTAVSINGSGVTEVKGGIVKIN